MDVAVSGKACGGVLKKFLLPNAMMKEPWENNQNFPFVVLSMSSQAKKLSFLMAVSLVLGNMIGSGIFLLPASLAPFGSVSLLGWVISAGGTIFLALTFAFLARCVPRTGGMYVYTREGFGSYAGFLVAWGYWVAIWAGNAAIAVAMVGYLSHFFPGLAENKLLGAITAVSSIWLLVCVNLRGVREAGWIQLVTTLIKIIPLAAVTVGGCIMLNPQHFVPFHPAEASLGSSITAAAALTLWAFMGIESATIPAEDVIEPEKTIPRATLVGAILAALIYMGATIGVMGLVPRETLMHSAAPFADAAQVLAGPWAGHGVAFGGFVATFGALNGWILLSGQIPFAAARDQLLPSFLAKTTASGSPKWGLIIAACASTPIILLNYHQSLVAQFSFIILLATLSALIPYLFSTMAAIVLMKDRTTGSKRRGMMAIASIAFLYSLWAIAASGETIVYWGFLLLMAGTPIYVWMHWQYSKNVEKD